MNSLSRTAKATVMLAGAVLLAGVFQVSALTISPAKYDLTADKGTTVEGDFVLINEQNDTTTFYTSVQNFEAQGETGTPNFTDAKTGLASWVSLEPQVTLKKGEKRQVHFKVIVPPNADPGGYFAAIFMSTVPPETDGGSGVSVGAKVGMLLLFRVNGEIKEGGGVLAFGLKNGWWNTSKPINFVYRFNNAGNDRVNPTGEIVVRNIFGLRSAVLNANPTSGNILPTNTRSFEIAWGSESIDEQASFSDHVAYEWRNFALGLYFARMDLSFGTSGTSSNRTAFIVFPWHLMIVLVIIAAILFFVGRKLLIRYNRWIIKQARGN